jgi:riboflavin synthase
MFTGIITHTGIIRHIDTSGDWNFSITVPDFTHGLAAGASVACNGVCLTVTKREEDCFSVQVSQETLARTTLKRWREGSRINLERALRAGDELGGHFVSGHVDTTVTLLEKERIGDSQKLTFFLPGNISRFIAEKGSVTLDGVSLTVNEVKEKDFSVNIIPHTLQATTLSGCGANDEVNLEIDIIARYLSRLACPLPA